MPLKPCLKSSKASPQDDTTIVATSHPPIPEPTSRLPRTPSYIDYSALPYSQVYVHFPPSPTLASMHVVDSPRLYDRSPIIVSENSCAMPQRGCPGRTYATVDGVGRGVASSDNALPLPCPKLSFSSNAPPTIPLMLPERHGSSDNPDAVSIVPEDLRATCRALCPPGNHSPVCRVPHTMDCGKDADHRFMPCSRLYSSSTSGSSGGTVGPSSPSSSSFTSTWDTSSCLEGF